MKRIRIGCTSILTIAVVSLFISSCAPSYVAVRPTPPAYARPLAPGPGYVWVRDNWIWRGGRYEFVPGYWSAPRRGRVWIEGNWQARSGRYYWTPGRWRGGGRR